jgi:16S rRNA (uracil1498-N3)-methyltransferase
MRERRFLVQSLDVDQIEVCGVQRHHAVDVLRLRVGAVATLFDGRGWEAGASVVEITQERIVFKLAESPRKAILAELGLTLAVATPKGPRADWVVEKSAEFGVTRLVFIETQRGEVHPGSGKLERWRRKAGEAAKQSGAPIITSIESGVTIADLCGESTAAPAIAFGATDCSGCSFDEFLVRVGAGDASADEIVCFIGPEGGLTDAEIGALMSAGGQPVSFGRTTLRVETAAIAAAAIWAAFAGRKARLDQSSE